MTGTRPVFRGRSAFLFGFAPNEHEVAPGMHLTTWWGSPDLVMPDGVEERNVRLQAEDGGHSRGILYRRGGERTAIIFNHPRGDFSSHYLTPALLAAGYAVFGGQTRNLANDIDCIHEYLLADLAAQVRYLRAAGFEKVILCGNSGGGSLSLFYQAQALTPPPGRLTDTPAGDPYDLNGLTMSPADGIVLLAAHVGEGLYGLAAIDPSVTDETDPLSCDPALDMYNPDNGFREPPEPSAYSDEFLARYREAQRARCARVDAIARQNIERRRHYRAMMARADFGELPLKERLYITRMATASRYMTVWRTQANPAMTDLSIDPSKRVIGSLLGPDPHAVNYKFETFASVMTPEGWLSTWSGLSSRAASVANIEKVDQPLLIVSYTADIAVLPQEAQDMLDNAASTDKTLVTVDADHYGYAIEGEKSSTLVETGQRVTDWLKSRFPAAAA